MPFSVNTNGSALAAVRTLFATDQQLEKTQEHINSGLKIASATDDASTFCIAQGLRGDIAGFKAVTDAISFAQATIAVALNAAQSISDTLNVINQKIVAGQSANVDKIAIQNDINALLQQVEATASSAQFNGVNLLNNSNPSGYPVLTSLNRTDASGSVDAAYTNLPAENLTSSGLGIGGLNIAYTAQAISVQEHNFSVTDRVAFTVNGETKTFEFIANPNDPLLHASDIPVIIGSTVTYTLANFAEVAKTTGFSASYDAIGHIQFSSSEGDLSAQFISPDIGITTVGSNLIFDGSRLLDAGGNNISLHDQLTVHFGHLTPDPSDPTGWLTAGPDAFVVTPGPSMTFEFTDGHPLINPSAIPVSIGATNQDTLVNLQSVAIANGMTATIAGNVIHLDTNNLPQVSTGTPNFTPFDRGISFTPVTPEDNSHLALSQIQTAIQAVKGALSRLGTAATELDMQATFVKTLQDSLTVGVAQLVDADMAEESANLQAVQTRQQLGIQALSIANQAPIIIGSLFKKGQ